MDPLCHFNTLQYANTLRGMQTFSHPPELLIARTTVGNAERTAGAVLKAVGGLFQDGHWLSTLLDGAHPQRVVQAPVWSIPY